MRRRIVVGFLGARPTTAGGPRSPYWTWAMLLLVIVFFSAVRFRLLDSPLERDEGEYAYAGQLMLQGIAPYTLAYSMKLPGTYAAYALIMAGFGQSASGIHLGLLFVNAGTVVLMFLLGRKLFEARTGLIAAASYALLSASPDVLGFAAHATNFVVLCSLAGVLALSRAIERGRRWRFAVSGGLLGLAVLMKQPGVFVCMFGVVWLLAVELRRKPIDWRQMSGRFASFAAAMLLPLVVTGLVLWTAGVFGTFWFWTVTYAGAYASAVPASQVLHNLREGLEAAVFPNGTVWALSGIGLVLLLLDTTSRRRAPWVVGFIVCSVLSIVPGFYFRPHYFILLLPGVALACGVAVHAGTNLVTKVSASAAMRLVPVSTVLVLLGYGLLQQWPVLFQLPPVAISQVTYRGNPFVEIVEVGRYLREHASPNATIAVLGSEPEVYFYARRRSATGYLYTYALMEDQPFAGHMQREMIREIEEARPEFLVFVGFPYSWSVGAKSDPAIFRWFNRYRERYETVGLIDVFSPEERAARWGGDATNAEPRAEFYVEVLRWRGL